MHSHGGRMPMKRTSSKSAQTENGAPPQEAGIICFFRTLYLQLFEIVKLNILFLLSCIPLITIPAACSAASRITIFMIKDEDYKLWTQFWLEFRRDFIKSLTGGLLLFPCAAAAGFGALFYCRALPQHSLFYVPFLACCSIFALCCMAGFNLFPMIAVIDLPLWKLIKNAFLIIFLRPLPHLAAFFSTAFLTLISFLCLPYTAPVIFLLLFAAVELIGTFAVYEGIETYIADGQTGPQKH